MFSKAIDVLTGQEGFIVGYCSAKYDYSTERMILIMRKSKVLARKKTVSMKSQIIQLLFQGEIEEAETKLAALESQYSLAKETKKRLTVVPDIKKEETEQPKRRLSGSSFLPLASSRSIESTKSNSSIVKRSGSLNGISLGLKFSTSNRSLKANEAIIDKLDESEEEVAISDTPRTVDEELDANALKCSICDQQFTTDFALQKHRDFSSLHQLKKSQIKENNRKARIGDARELEVLQEGDIVSCFESVKALWKSGKGNIANILFKVYDVQSKNVLCVFPVNLNNDGKSNSLLPLFFLKKNLVEGLLPQYNTFSKNGDSFVFDDANKQVKYEKALQEKHAAMEKEQKVKDLSDIIINCFETTSISNGGFTLVVKPKNLALVDQIATKTLTLNEEEIKKANNFSNLSLRETLSFSSEGLNELNIGIKNVKNDLQGSVRKLSNVEETLRGLPVV